MPWSTHTILLLSSQKSGSYVRRTCTCTVQPQRGGIKLAKLPGGLDSWLHHEMFINSKQTNGAKDEPLLF